MIKGDRKGNERQRRLGKARNLGDGRGQKGLADTDDEQTSSGTKLVSHERDAAQARGRRNVAKAAKRG
jgi:hypothetical protein